MKKQNENILFSHPQLYLNIKQMNVNPDTLYRDIHFHKEIELIKVTSGSILCYIEKEQIILHQDELLLINRNVFHKLTGYQAKAEITYMQINISSYEKVLFDSTDKNITLIPFINENIKKYEVYSVHDKINEIFQSIISETQSKAICYKQYIKAYIFNLVSLIYRNGILQKQSTPSSKNSIQKILPALEFIQGNLTSKMTLNDICHTINMDKFYFCKLFKSITGYTPTGYINSLRIDLAKKMIIESEKNISEITYETGFTSTQHFNKVFKGIAGCTPKEYKKYFMNNVY